jgi:hypothetical protein
MIEPPSNDAIDSAVKRLKDVGALYQVKKWYLFFLCTFLN